MTTMHLEEMAKEMTAAYSMHLLVLCLEMTRPTAIATALKLWIPYVLSAQAKRMPIDV